MRSDRIGIGIIGTQMICLLVTLAGALCAWAAEATAPTGDASERWPPAAFRRAPAAPRPKPTLFVNAAHPGASDENPGTKEKPWKSIGRAAATAGPGDVVLVAAGSYAERVRPANGGTEQRPLTFLAQGKVVTRGFVLAKDYLRVIGFTVTAEQRKETPYEHGIECSGIGCQILENTVGAIAVNVHGVRNVRVYNNLFIRGRYVAVRLFDGCTGSQVFNNIVIGAGSGIDAVWVDEKSKEGTTADHNMTSIRPSAQNVSGPHDITGTVPLFVDADGLDFHLRSGSPGMDAGTDLSRTASFATDKDGRRRPAGKGWDLGPYET